MSINVEQRESGSPLVRTIWRARCSDDGSFPGKADSSWGLIVLRHRGATQISLIGPATQAVRFAYRAGMEYLGMCFQLGIFLPHTSIGQAVNSTMVLPNATQHSFWLDDTTCPFPDYHDVEAFAEKLLRQRLLARDSVVEHALAARDQSLTQRTVQRHFLHTTGLTYSTIAMIERARAAVQLLERGTPILDVVHATGYTDQPHLTNSLKRLIGQTPAQISRLKS